MKILYICLIFFGFYFSSWAVEVAPRITDREIIESLATLEANQKLLFQRLDQMQASMDQRFEQMQASMDQRFEQMQTSMDQRFEQVQTSIDQRFEQMQTSMDQQIGRLHTMMTSMFGLLSALIITLFGYIIWDRRTALKPLEERFNQLAKDLEHDLQIRHDSGSLLTRLVGALRELAVEDAKVEKVLKSFSLL